MEKLIDKNDDIGHASRGKMDDLKVAVYYVDFNVTKSLGGGGDIWAAQPPLKLQKHSLFPAKVLVLYCAICCGTFQRWL